MFYCVKISIAPYKNISCDKVNYPVDSFVATVQAFQLR